MERAALTSLIEIEGKSYTVETNPVPGKTGSPR